jgi:y4mF family transcriptional regulator
MAQPIDDGQFKTVSDLGRFVRAYRKKRGLTLETVSGLSNVGPRFLSEFERGKETAEIGKILKVLRVLGLDLHVRPRGARG